MILLMCVPDLIGRVRNGETPPFRPILPADAKAEHTNPLKELMIECWSEDPSNRPDFTEIKKKFSAINKGK